MLSSAILVSVVRDAVLVLKKKETISLSTPIKLKRSDLLVGIDIRTSSVNVAKKKKSNTVSKLYLSIGLISLCVQLVYWC